MFMQDGIVDRKIGMKVKRMIMNKISLIDFCHERGLNYQQFNGWISLERKYVQHSETFRKAVQEFLGLTAEELDAIEPEVRNATQ